MNPYSPGPTETPAAEVPLLNAFTGAALMKTFLGIMIVLAALTGIAAVKGPPDAPSAVAANAFIESTASTRQLKTMEAKLIDRTFIGMALASTASTFADSYTILFARENYLAGKEGACNIEVQSAYLYRTHPTVGRTYAVASANSAGSILPAYHMLKDHTRFWSLPLVANTAISLEGVTQNMMACN
jgi:hypothetical protein